MVVIMPLQEMVRRRQVLGQHKLKLVMTNGCFDLLHIGHVRYLQAARRMGDALLVAVNSDASVRRIKGPSRPVVPELERAEIIGSLRSVDYVMLFDDPTPAMIIDAIVPDILVKGSDWKIENIVGRKTVEAAGGKVVTVDLVRDLSTSAIIKRIAEVHA